MSQVQRHRPCGADVAEYDDRSSGLPTMVMDRRNGVFDGYFKSVTTDEGPVREKEHGGVQANGSLQRINDSLAAGGIQNVEDFGNGPACRILPRPASHFFCDEIEEGDISGNVRTNNGVSDAVEGDLGAFLFAEQRLLHAVALNGMSERSGKCAIFDLTFDQVVLCALLHSFSRQCLVVQSCQYNERDAWGDRMNLSHGIEAMRIWQPHVQEHDVYVALRQMNHGFTQAQ